MMPLLDVKADKYRITHNHGDVSLYKNGHILDEEVSPAFLRTAWVLNHTQSLLKEIIDRHESGACMEDLISEAKDTLDEDRTV